MSYLISLTEAKNFLQLPTTTTTDALLQDYIDMVESEISGYLNRNLALATYTEVLDYDQSRFDQSRFRGLETTYGYPSLQLKNYPVTSLSIANVSTSSYTYNPANGVIKPQFYLATPTASYTAGYTTVTAPNELKLLAKQGFASMYKNNLSGATLNIKSKSNKDFSVTYESQYIDGVKTYLAVNKHILQGFMKVDL